MKTYLDVFKAVENGQIVIITNHFGNTRKYFKNNSGFICCQFNKCIHHIVRDTKNNSNIETPFFFEILKTNL